MKKVGSSSVTRREALIPRHYDESADDYIAAELLKDNVPDKFVVGDKLTYGQYYNAPLQTGAEYQIRVGSVSRGNETVRLQRVPNCHFNIYNNRRKWYVWETIP